MEINWRRLINRAEPSMGEVTKESVDCAKDNAKRFRGSMRMSTGRVWTDKEIEERRQYVLNTPLP